MLGRTIALVVLAALNSSASFAEKLQGAELRAAMQMQQAVLGDRDITKVKALLRDGFDINLPIGCGTFSVVDGAVAIGDVEMLKVFLDAGARPVGSALIAAARKKEARIAARLVELLLKKGADPNFKESYGGAGFTTPLHGAAFQGNRKVVELLLKSPGIAVNLVDVDGRTPEMWATQRGHSEVARILREARTRQKAGIAHVDRGN
ncbi:MAG TPA: ankyrin repeat domain-containing protein [Candidatus Kapabacteria bacterium]|nr:ankyrin repeat domain-containing protein [Candidatus Kapabacteria bacterium]